ncbi:hypothetical protein ONR57_22210 [Hoyosella sp. YIM 151337]|nr:hypothetical protein [Hoyosella sp. YIM 151337]
MQPHTVLKLSGTLDALSLPRFFTILEMLSEPAQLLVDLSRVDFCSVSAVRALTELRMRDALSDTAIAIIAPEHVRSVFALAQQQPGVTVHASLSDAAESASRRGVRSLSLAQ